jgi:hypothetical protein
MPQVTPQFVFDLESEMRIEAESAYEEASRNLWYQRVMRSRTTQAKHEIVMFLLSTAFIYSQGDRGGNVRYDDIVSAKLDMYVKHAGNGLKLPRDQFEDVDAHGMDTSAQWARDVGALMAYWPQYLTNLALQNGHSTSFTVDGQTYQLAGYDGKALFAADHPLNPANVGLGVYHNIFTGSAGTDTGTGLTYPGACPIDDSVDVDDALVNLTKIFAYIRSIRTPNAKTPRFLRPTSLLVPPRMLPRAAQLTNAKFIAQASNSAAASADVQALIASLGLSTLPVEVPELAGFESDTTFFVVCEPQMQASPIGSLIYLEREPFNIQYYTGQGPANPELARAQELEWLNHGRNGVGIGHPFFIFKCKAT